MSTRKTLTEWTPKHIQRFWNWYGSNPNVQQTYFSHYYGKAIFYFLKLTGRLQGKLLDYGCGPGHLLKFLLKEKLECYGADSSQKSVSAINSSFSTYPNWKGGSEIKDIITPYPSNFFDVITCIETIEHLHDDVLKSLFQELKRLVKPGGIVLFTTPFNEDPEANMAYCPFCDSEYHRWQHLQFFTEKTLKALLEANGYQIMFCQSMDFDQFRRSPSLGTLFDISPAKIFSRLTFVRRKVLDRLFPMPFPQSRDLQFRLQSGSNAHLCALATKPK